MQVPPSSKWFGSLCLSLLLLVGCAQSEDGTPRSPVEGESPVEHDAPSTGMPPSSNGDTGTPSPPAADPAPSWCPASSSHSNIPPIRERGTAEGGNATGVHGCTSSRYAHYEHASTQGQSPQLHVISIYEPAENANGSVEVHVKRRGHSVLVLSAYSETTWKVVVEPHALVERILVSGYEPQHVVAPAGIPVEVHSYTQDREYLDGFGYEWPSYRTTQLIDEAEAKEGHELTSFRGCYASSGFEIDEPGELRPPHTVSNKTVPTLPVGCEAMAKEPVQCMTMDYHVPTIIGLDSGRTCSSQVPSNFGVGPDASSLAWRGDYVYACVHDRGLARISLLDGSVDIAPIACRAVASHRGGLLVMLDYDGTNPSLLGALVHFDDFEAAARHQATCLFNIRPFASRMAVHGDRGYFAWHSTDEISTAELSAKGVLQNVGLEGYDDWIFGMDATDDGRLLILGPRPEPGLHIFNAGTGESMGFLPLGGNFLQGLSCWSRDQAPNP